MSYSTGSIYMIGMARYDRRAARSQKPLDPWDMKRSDFERWFNADFWRAFNKLTVPIEVPKHGERAQLLRRVYDSITSARYAPSIPVAEVVMNKGYGVARTVPVFCIEDYCVYYFCIKELEEVLCVNRTANTFGGWSLGGRLRRQESDEIECEQTEYGRYSFNPLAWTAAFGEFNSLLFSQLDQGRHSYVLQFDLSNFYDCVRLDILERWIREEAGADKGWIITLLFYLLNQWNRRNTGLHPQAVGLPMDALQDCSRILANFYLQKYDTYAAQTCARAGGVYFRYADDQMILMNGRTKAEELLLLLTRKLDSFGLRVNQKKVDLWKAGDLQEHRCRSIQAIFANRGDNRKPALVKRFTEQYLSLSTKQVAQSWNQGFPLLNRLLFADLGSLPKSLFERITRRFMRTDYLAVATKDKLERIYELNRKRRSPLQLERIIGLIGRASVHNAYHYEVLAFCVSKKLADLEQLFRVRLEEIDSLMNGSGEVDAVT